MSEQDQLAERNPSYAWIVAAASFGFMALAFGGLGTVTVFLKPMISEFGWSRGEASLGYTVISLSAAILGLFWGYFADRWGCRWATIIAALSMFGAFFLLSRTETLWQFYLGYSIFGGFGFAALFSPVTATAGFWFERNKGLAIGLVSAGGAVGAGAVPFCARLLITDYGWQNAFMILAICYLAIALPLVLLIREAPARLAARSNTSPESTGNTNYPIASNEVVFWIAPAALFCCVCMAVPLVHVVPMISDRGISPQIAASVLMVLMTAGIIGRILGGVSGERFGALPAYIFFSLGQTVLAFLFPHIAGLTGLYILAVMFGVLYSGDMVSIPYCLRVMLPAAFAGRGLSIVTGLAMVGMGLGGYIGGALYDFTGEYTWSFAAASLAGTANLIILGMFHQRRKRQIALFAQA
jgi:MFS family permease